MSTNPISFLVFCVAMVASPGPANMVLLSAGAKYGFLKSLPFCIGVILGMQIIIWLVGFGILKIALSVPWLFNFLSVVSAIYIFWLAWKISTTRIRPEKIEGAIPSIYAGLLVHPLNPKAWVIVTGAFAHFTAPNISNLSNMITISIGLLLVTSVFQTLWCGMGSNIAKIISGRPSERWVMYFLGILTVVSVLWAIFY